DHYGSFVGGVFVPAWGGDPGGGGEVKCRVSGSNTWAVFDVDYARHLGGHSPRSRSTRCSPGDGERHRPGQGKLLGRTAGWGALSKSAALRRRPHGLTPQAIAVPLGGGTEPGL